LHHSQVPLLCAPEDGISITTNAPFICMSAIQIVSGRKVSFWCICINTVQSNTITEHGFVGKPSNNSKVQPETIDSLCAFFGKIEVFCDVIPMQFVRNKTGTTTTRDDKEKALTLPPCWSKQSMYC
jgi:hypothetical protein